MFANEKFIEASRKFVCIRIETYESEQSEKMVRSLLGGAFANTAFCVFDPSGKKRLSRSGRGPQRSLASRGRPGSTKSSQDNEIVSEMNRIAARYKSRGNERDVVLQDFDSFRQALNVASADQRLLVVVDAKDDDQKQVEDALKKVFVDRDVVGKFHLTFIDKKTDRNWSKSIDGRTKAPGVIIIRAGTFGLDGAVLDHLPVTTSVDDFKTALLDANTKFAKLEDRKSYAQHVSQGRRQRIYFENEIPYGEDRDGDGKIDKQKRGRSR